MRITKLPAELFSASVRSKDHFYGAVAKYLTIGQILEIA
jgi:hypothetical protein